MAASLQKDKWHRYITSTSFIRKKEIWVHATNFLTAPRISLLYWDMKYYIYTHTELLHLLDMVPNVQLPNEQYYNIHEGCSKSQHYFKVLRKCKPATKMQCDWGREKKSQRSRPNCHSTDFEIPTPPKLDLTWNYSGSPNPGPI